MLPPSVVTIPRTELPMETIVGVLSYKKARDRDIKEKETKEKDPKEKERSEATLLTRKSPRKSQLTFP